MGGGVEHLILSGPVLLAIPVAAAAGAITFMSPCCLPLVPGYLSYLTGMSGAAANGRGDSGSATAEADQAVAAGSLSLSPAVAVAGAAGPGVRSGNSSPAATVDTAGHGRAQHGRDQHGRQQQSGRRGCGRRRAATPRPGHAGHAAVRAGVLRPVRAGGRDRRQRRRRAPAPPRGPYPDPRRPHHRARPAVHRAVRPVPASPAGS